MPTLDSIKNKYHFNIDEISDIIFMWARSEDEEDFIKQFVDKFEIEENDVFFERDLTTLYDELSESDEIRQIVDESRKLHNERSSRKYRSRRPLRKFESHKPTMKESKKVVKESFGSDFKEGDSVIVKDRNDANLGIGQVITIDRIDGNYIIFTRRGKSFGIPKSCVKSLNESKKRSSQQRTMTGQYVQMIKEGHSHKAVVEAIAKKYGMSVAEAENTINECLGVAGINRKRVIKEAEEEQNFETQDTENFEDFENNEEDYDEIADKVLIYMMKNSNDYKQFYRNIEDAVDATLTFMRLKDQIGENGTKKIVEIIRDKYVDDFNFNDTDYMDDDSITDKVEESCVDKYALECVNENVGTPNYWTMDEKHYIAGFEDKLFTEEAVSKLKENKYFDFIAENENYSFIYILKKVKGE